MVAELCQYVIIGHSERRQLFGETDETVNKKIQSALAHDLTPIMAIGETLDENQAGQTAEVLTRQLRLGLAGLAASPELTAISAIPLVIAYEPVWAIGTGLPATGEGANQVVADIIRPTVSEIFGPVFAQSVRVLYGGSVKAVNAAEFFSQPDIDGALVGGASLRAMEFTGIVQAAAA
jgi:triosephosphate isomerase